MAADWFPPDLLFYNNREEDAYSSVTVFLKPSASVGKTKKSFSHKAKLRNFCQTKGKATHICKAKQRGNQVREYAHTVWILHEKQAFSPMQRKQIRLV